MKINKALLCILLIVISLPLLGFGWEYAKGVSSTHRLLIPFGSDAVDISIIEINSNHFAVAVSKVGISICQVK